MYDTRLPWLQSEWACMYLAAGVGRAWLQLVHPEGGRAWCQLVHPEGGRAWLQLVHPEGGRGWCLEGAGRVRTLVGDTDQLDTGTGPPDIELCQQQSQQNNK